MTAQVEGANVLFIRRRREGLMAGAQRGTENALRARSRDDAAIVERFATEQIDNSLLVRYELLDPEEARQGDSHVTMPDIDAFTRRRGWRRLDDNSRVEHSGVHSEDPTEDSLNPDPNQPSALPRPQQTTSREDEPKEDQGKMIFSVRDPNAKFSCEPRQHIVLRPWKSSVADVSPQDRVISIGLAQRLFQHALYLSVPQRVAIPYLLEPSNPSLLIVAPPFSGISLAYLIPVLHDAERRVATKSNARAERAHGPQTLIITRGFNQSRAIYDLLSSPPYALARYRRDGGLLAENMDDKKLGWCDIVVRRIPDNRQLNDLAADILITQAADLGAQQTGGESQILEDYLAQNTISWSALDTIVVDDVDAALSSERNRSDSDVRLLETLIRESAARKVRLVLTTHSTSIPLIRHRLNALLNGRSCAILTVRTGRTYRPPDAEQKDKGGREKLDLLRGEDHRGVTLRRLDLAVPERTGDWGGGQTWNHQQRVEAATTTRKVEHERTTNDSRVRSLDEMLSTCYRENRDEYRAPGEFEGSDNDGEELLDSSTTKSGTPISDATCNPTTRNDAAIDHGGRRNASDMESSTRTPSSADWMRAGTSQSQSPRARSGGGDRRTPSRRGDEDDGESGRGGRDPSQNPTPSGSAVQGCGAKDKPTILIVQIPATSIPLRCALTAIRRTTERGAKTLLVTPKQEIAAQIAALFAVENVGNVAVYLEGDRRNDLVGADPLVVWGRAVGPALNEFAAQEDGKPIEILIHTWSATATPQKSPNAFEQLEALIAKLDVKKVPKMTIMLPGEQTPAAERALNEAISRARQR